jgi:ABC-2 type transport system ATP-binding protein
MIELRDVSVRYGSTVAVEGIDLDLPTGKIYGLLGRNGSGKTSSVPSPRSAARRPARSGWTAGTRSRTRR